MNEERTVTREQKIERLDALYRGALNNASAEAEKVREAALLGLSLAALPAPSEDGLLSRNVLINDDHGFEGAWVAVPREDFDRAVMALDIAARFSTPSGDGLAAALDIINDLMEEMDWVGTGDRASGDIWRAGYEKRIAALEAAPVGLDVGLLARAIVKATREQAGEPDGPGWPGYVHLGKPRDVAVVLNVTELTEAIAREYARLSRETGRS